MQRHDPGNAWPAGMTISISDANNQLYLLFVRSAWHIEDTGVPELEQEPPVGSSIRPDTRQRAEVENRWRSEWERAWTEFAPRHTGVHAPDAETQQLLDSLSDAELWHATSTRPSDFWAEGVDSAAFLAWRVSLRPNVAAPLEEHPERRSLPALVAAWRTGLKEIIELPFAGYYAERIDRERLIVSGFTRRDTELYSRALGTEREA